MILLCLYCFSEASKYFSDIYSRVLSSRRPYQALTIITTSKTILKIKLSLFFKYLLPFNSAKNWCLGTGQARQSLAHKWIKADNLKRSENETKNFPLDPSTPPTPSRLLLPGISPPLRPLLTFRLAKGGGTSILVPFNLLPTSDIAFCRLSHPPSHSCDSSKSAPGSSRCSLSPSPVCPGSLNAHQLPS